MESRKNETEIKKSIKAVYYGDKLNRVEISSRPIFTQAGYELAEFRPKETHEKRILSPQEVAENEQRAIKRAKQQLKDLVSSNHFDLFVTLTISPESGDRYNYADCYRYFRNWASNRVQRNNMHYVCVPELHKDGAIHFHGLVSEVPTTDSGIRHNGKPIYNIPSWVAGFSTAERIEENTEQIIANYCSKYIIKDMQKIGGRYYYHGGELQQPRIILLDDITEVEGLTEGKQPSYQQTVEFDFGTYQKLYYT